VADTILDSAIDIARDAALEIASDEGEVGDHLGSSEDGGLLVTHLFGARVPGYRGWVWAVTVSRCPDDDTARICEANLIPADDALLAPPWVPWSDRVQPGDLEPGMILPFVPEDPRIVPGYEVTDDEDADAVALWELGLGRARVLGADGRDDTAERWYAGTHGPNAPEAIAATASCATCGFHVALSGSWRMIFGVCTNEWSPSDGKVVSLDHGCGAHSETDVEGHLGQWPANAPIVDTVAATIVDLTAEEFEEEALAVEPVAEEETAPEEETSPE
jgi:hypothetical protein